MIVSPIRRLLFLVACLFIQECSAERVGLVIVATGKYISFVQPLIESARKHFCTNHDVTFFVFTDGDIEGQDIVRIEQQRMGWPYDTMMRWPMYFLSREAFAQMDYLFALDADMLFEGPVGDEILSERVSVLHPGYVGRRGTYETRRNSAACVRSGEGSCYFAGGFNGGSRDEFIQMARMITQAIGNDLAHDLVAVWHDESHVNRYWIDNPPTTILTPSYCYPQNARNYIGRWPEQYPRKLVALDKHHASLRK